MNSTDSPLQPPDVTEHLRGVGRMWAVMSLLPLLVLGLKFHPMAAFFGAWTALGAWGAGRWARRVAKSTAPQGRATYRAIPETDSTDPPRVTYEIRGDSNFIRSFPVVAENLARRETFRVQMRAVDPTTGSELVVLILPAETKRP